MSNLQFISKECQGKLVQIINYYNYHIFSNKQNKMILIQIYRLTLFSFFLQNIHTILYDVSISVCIFDSIFLLRILY